MATKDARSLSPSAQEAFRIRAVQAVLEGQKQSDVARILGVTVQSISNWVKRHRREGDQALKAGKRGRPKGGLLLPWQAGQIVRTLCDRCPDDLRLPFTLWTRDAVSELIELRFGLHLSVWTVGRCLERWGFIPPRPLRRAYEYDPETVERWLEQEYRGIRKQAKEERALILWGSETGLRRDPVAKGSQGPAEIHPAVVESGRVHRRMISALTNRNHFSFMVHKDAFSEQVFIEFLRRLLHEQSRKVFLIVNTHPVYRAQETHRWLERNRGRIEIFHLPTYGVPPLAGLPPSHTVKANPTRK